jgi:predicted amidohydrolase YtcJ
VAARQGGALAPRGPRKIPCAVDRIQGRGREGALSAGRTTLLTAQRVHSFAPGQAADAVLIDHGVVTAVGSADALRRGYRVDRTLDLGNAVLTPGLTDAHIHLLEWALTRQAADLSRTSSPHEAVSLLRAARPAWPLAGWLRGRGWNPHGWHGVRPHHRLLDEWLPGQGPIVLQSHDMHALWVNAEALSAAGVDASTPDPHGGRIERDEAGQPTGVLYDNACLSVIRALPMPAAENALAAVEDAQRTLHAAGITGVHALPGILIPEPEPLAVLESLRAAGRLRLRVLQHLRIEQLEHARALGLRSGFGGDWIRIGGVKLFLDGALGSRTAWMRAPYEGSADCGIRVLEPAAFLAAVRLAAAAGFAATVHAIGDAAVALALDVLRRPELRVATLPHRIEHVQCAPADRFDEFAGVVCSVQPAHLITDWRAVDAHWGGERARATYAFASLQRAGAVLAFGSDAPVEPIDPQRTLHAAVTRTDIEARPAGGWQPAERLDRCDAWRALTTGPARAAAWEDRLGAIEPGRYADFAAWDRDPLTCPDNELLELRCVATFCAGELVHST